MVDVTMTSLWCNCIIYFSYFHGIVDLQGIRDLDKVGHFVAFRGVHSDCHKYSVTICSTPACTDLLNSQKIGGCYIREFRQKLPFKILIDDMWLFNAVFDKFNSYSDHQTTNFNFSGYCKKEAKTPTKFVKPVVMATS